MLRGRYPQKKSTDDEFGVIHFCKRKKKDIQMVRILQPCHDAGFYVREMLVRVFNVSSGTQSA